MRINATFFIQIINFWITYSFFKKLLLKPVVDLLNRRESARQNLFDGLKEKEIFLKQKVEEKTKAAKKGAKEAVKDIAKNAAGAAKTGLQSVVVLEPRSRLALSPHRRRSLRRGREQSRQAARLHRAGPAGATTE